MSSAPTFDELESLAVEHGDGFWILDLELFRANLDSFVNAFVTAGWTASTIAWSFKTMWVPDVVHAAVRAGALAEVVSGHEYELALRLAIDPAHIVFNGPLKSRDELERATGLGSLVQLDSPDEVADVELLARQHSGREFRIGLRANLDIGQSSRGRFGLDAETGDLQRAFATLRAHSNVRVEGLHVHLSGARSPEMYTRRIRRLIRLADELWPDGAAPQYLDLGGGFTGAIPESLAAQLSEPPATAAEYAAAIVPALLARWPHRGPRLLLEPGMALMADAMQFAARVGATKTIDGKHHAVVGASVYAVKPTLHGYDMPMSVLRADGAAAPAGDSVVTGWTCVEADVLSRNCRFHLTRGDWLLIENSGAYTFVLSPRFVRGTPAIVARDKPSGWRAVRPADGVTDWLSPFGDSA